MEYPSTCVFCKHFPCLPQDKEATVISEVKGSYPFLSEDDSFKPCEGERFTPIGLEEKPVLSPPLVPSTVAPETVKFVYFIKNSDPDMLQRLIDKLTDGDEVVTFNIPAMTSAFDSDSSKMNIIVAVEVVYDKKKYEALQNVPKLKE